MQALRRGLRSDGLDPRFQSEGAWHVDIGEMGIDQAYVIQGECPAGVVIGAGIVWRACERPVVARGIGALESKVGTFQGQFVDGDVAAQEWEQVDAECQTAGLQQIGTAGPRRAAQAHVLGADVRSRQVGAPASGCTCPIPCDREISADLERTAGGCFNGLDDARFQPVPVEGVERNRCESDQYEKCREQAGRPFAE